MAKRKIIEIDEEKCNGCGDCILACAEGALAMVDGKAKLVGEVYCDGLGACLGECPSGALKVVEREACKFDEKEVEKHLKKSHTRGPVKHEHAAGHFQGCPGSAAMNLKPARPTAKAEDRASALSHWPIKLRLLGSQAPFLKGADLVLLADCCGVALPGLHSKLVDGRAIALACPKFDDLDEHIEHLAEMIKVAGPKSITVVIMEVPCCRGLLHAAEQARIRAGVKVPIVRMVVGRDGRVLDESVVAA
jgi:NAD-dependent dihydropyrimidine dehydrogenase PreA subunit